MGSRVSPAPRFQVEISVGAQFTFSVLDAIPRNQDFLSEMDSLRMNQFMKSAMKKWQPFAIAMSVSAMVVVVGCGDDSGLARRYAVKGKVTYKGAPVPHGTVNFLPTDPPPPEGRAATGDIKDGYYSLTTVGDFDGALPGKYMVAIVAQDIDMASAASSKAEGGMVHQGDAAYQKAVKSGKSLIPSKYGVGETSGLKATVETSAKTVDFELTD
jgi:major membrane immunogen (membrane-anchored lipoprotein)